MVLLSLKKTNPMILLHVKTMLTKLSFVPLVSFPKLTYQTSQLNNSLKLVNLVFVINRILLILELVFNVGISNS